MTVESWNNSLTFYNRLDYIDICSDYRDILQSLYDNWKDRVDIFTSHFSPCFTHPCDKYPFGEYVKVDHIRGYYTIILANDKHIVVTSSAVEPGESPLLKIESVLVQLVGEK